MTLPPVVYPEFPVLEIPCPVPELLEIQTSNLLPLKMSRPQPMISRIYHPLVIVSLCILQATGCQQGNYDVVVLKSEVKELQRELEKLKETHEATDAAEHRVRISNLESELIQIRQQLNSRISQISSEPDGANNVAIPNNFVLGDPASDSGDSEPTTPDSSTPVSSERIETAISAFESAGHTLVLDDKGRVVSIDASQFPLELSTIQLAESFENLKQLAVSGPRVTSEMFDVFSRLTSLERLDLEVTIANTEQLEKLTTLKNLKFIQLFRTDIDDDSMAVLARFPALEQIRCGQTRVGDAGLLHLSNMNQLRALDLSDCNRVSASGVAAIARLPNLKFLKVWGSQINDAVMDSIAQIKTLEVLGLNDTMVSDAGIEKLENLTALKEIHLVRTRVGDSGIAVLAGLPELSTLGLRDTQLSDEGLSHISHMKKLTNLDLSENRSPGITDAGMAHLSKLDTLLELNLWTTAVGDAGVAQLTGLTKLKSLNLDKTRITNAACESLTKMPQLEWLHLGSNPLGDEAIEPLTRLPNLTYLNLSHTNISSSAWIDVDDAISDRGGILIPP